MTAFSVTSNLSRYQLKIAYKDAEGLIDTIAVKLIPCKTGVVDKTEIKDAVLEVLNHFDKIALSYFKARH